MILLKELWESKFFTYFITFLFVFCLHLYVHGFPQSSVGKVSTCSARHLSLIPGLGKSAGEGIGYPLQYSGLENSKDCIVHGDKKSQTQLSNLHLHFHIFMIFLSSPPPPFWLPLWVTCSPPYRDQKACVSIRDVGGSNGNYHRMS